MGRASGDEERDSQGRSSWGGGKKDGSHDMEGKMRRELEAEAERRG